MKLTDLKCKTAKAKDTIQKFFDGAGLYLEVRPNGTKTWRYKYRLFDKDKNLTLGRYPENTLAEARQKHKQAHKLVFDGIDPMSAREQNNLIRKAELNNTFELIAKEWLENKSEEWSKDYCKTILTRLEKDLFPKIGQMPIKTINPPILLGALREIEKRGVFETTKRARQYAGQIFRYAIAIGKAERDPSHDIKDALKNKRVEHFKAMDLKDLPEFIKKINQNDARLFRQTCLALKLMVLTFTRKSELCNARWQEIDLKNKVWIIPAERMKMRKEHLVPLSRQALEIFQELHELNSKWEYVFVSQISARKPMNEDTILRALYRLGYKGKATIHGFRALALTTIIEKLGYRFEIPDRQLAHSKGSSVKQAYDRAEFLEDRKKMMQDWADYVDGLITV